MKKFRDDITGKIIEVERETKVLILKKVENGDYYKGKNHDLLIFVDNENNEYQYDAALNVDQTEYDTKIGEELAFNKNKHIKLSAYFLPPSASRNTIYIYNPRLLSIED